MRFSSRLAVVGLATVAAIGLGSLAFALPAAADVAAFPVSANTLTTQAVTATTDAGEAGKAKARELNGLMDGDGCDPPLILC